MLKGITCVTFDDDIKASQGLWLYNENVVVSDNACMSGTCGFFNSSAQSKLELAYFSNSLDIFETFSVSFFFKRSPGVSGQRSLLDNSQCSDDGSLYAKSVSGGVSGSATNSVGDSVDFDSIVCTHFLQDSNSNCVFFKVSIYYHLQWNYLLIFISWLYIVYILLWHFLRCTCSAVSTKCVQENCIWLNVAIYCYFSIMKQINQASMICRNYLCSECQKHEIFY